MNTGKTFLTAGAITAFSLSLGFGQADQNREVGATENYTQERTIIREQPIEQEQDNLSPQDRMQQQDQLLQQQGQQEFGAQPESRQTQTQVQTQSQHQAQKMTDLKGSEVHSSDGKRIGTVDDLTVNLQTGDASYLIVSAGGFLGIGGELRPIPLSAVEFQQREGDVRAVLSIPEQQWENAPTVEREQIASLSQESRAREIYSFYGEDYQQRQQQQRQFGAPPRSGQSQDETIDQLLQQHRERQQQQQQQSSSSPSQESQSSATSSPSSGTSQSSQQEFGAPNRESSSSSGQSSSGQSSSSPSESSATSGGEQQSSQQEFGAATEQRSSQSAQMSQSQQAQTQQSQSQQQQIQLASDLMDKEVTNSQQQKLGKISDLLIDTQQGRIAFVLLEPDSAFWQSPEETFAVAPQSFQTVSERQAVLNITQQDLEQAQMLNESNIEQHIQQAAASTSGQRRVFRYQESGESGSRGVFGSPDRSSESSRDAGQSDSSSGTNY